VIAAGGRIGGYGGNEALKRALLVAEGVAMRGSRVQLRACRVERARTPSPRQAGRPAAEARKKNLV
jgi:hypothetical protein